MRWKRRRPQANSVSGAASSSEEARASHLHVRDRQSESEVAGDGEGGRDHLGPGTVSHIRISQSSEPENRKLASSAMLITASLWPMCSPSS